MREMVKAGVVKTRDSWKWARRAGGWALILAGLLGFVLPVLPGFPLLLPGLALLAKDYAWARNAQDWLKAEIRKARFWWSGK
jgi:uncharacterized protein